MAARLAGRYGYPADEPFRVTLHLDRLDEPLRWKKPRQIFVSSMGDLFHESVPFGFVEEVWRRFTIKRHSFLVLTKRPQRMLDFYRYWRDGPDFEFWADNLWLGVTAENQNRAGERIPILLNIPAAVRFVSVEPMLEPVDIERWLPISQSYRRWREHRGDRDRWIDWFIIGCESGPNRRPMKLEWVVDLVRQCKATGVPVFVKQIEVNGRVSHDPQEWPEELRVRELPCQKEEEERQRRNK
jgi:protein gp37